LSVFNILLDIENIFVVSDFFRSKNMVEFVITTTYFLVTGELSSELGHSLLVSITFLIVFFDEVMLIIQLFSMFGRESTETNFLSLKSMNIIRSFSFLDAVESPWVSSVLLNNFTVVPDDLGIVSTNFVVFCYSFSLGFYANFLTVTRSEVNNPLVLFPKINLVRNSSGMIFITWMLDSINGFLSVVGLEHKTFMSHRLGRG